MTAPARPSATVVLLRDAVGGPEVLLLRRNARIVFHGGHWVFPGGSVDAADAGAADPAGLEAGRVAAVREAREEAGLAIDPAALVPLSHWTTPEHMPKRFSAWFFAARIDAQRVEVDGSEIIEHRFVRAADALEARDAGELILPPPTFHTLVELSRHGAVDAFLGAAAERPAPRFLPRYREVPDGPCSLLPGDVAYEGGSIEVEGARHRMWLPERGPWRLEQG